MRNPDLVETSRVIMLEGYIASHWVDNSFMQLMQNFDLALDKIGPENGQTE